MTFNREMFNEYLNKNHATFYIWFAVNHMTHCVNAYVLPVETVRRVPEIAPNLLDGGTDGVPRIKLLQDVTFEPAIRRAGGWKHREALNIKYADITIGSNGTRSDALEKLSKTVIEKWDVSTKSVKCIGNLQNTADLKVERVDGSVYYVEVKSRQGRFNVNSGNYEYTRGNQNYDYMIIWDNKTKSKMVKAEFVDTIIEFLHMELYQDSDIMIIDLKQKED